VLVHPAKVVKVAWCQEHPQAVREHLLLCPGSSQERHRVLHLRSLS
jgi:hypothetical protein